MTIAEDIAALHVRMVRAEDAGHSGEAIYYVHEIERLRSGVAVESNVRTPATALTVPGRGSTGLESNMTDRTCSVAGCGRPHKCRGYCITHYARWRRGADITAPVGPSFRPPRTGTAQQRLMRGTVTNDLGCILRTTSLNSDGYSTFWWHGRMTSAHRAAWQEVHGDLPADPDVTVDHLCRQPACINVEHMEIVSRAENARRGTGRHVSAANSRARTHCKRGHQFTPENTWRDKHGWRSCKACGRASQLRIAPARNLRRRAERGQP